LVELKKGSPKLTTVISINLTSGITTLLLTFISGLIICGEVTAKGCDTLISGKFTFGIFIVGATLGTTLGASILSTFISFLLTLISGSNVKFVTLFIGIVAPICICFTVL